MKTRWIYGGAIIAVACFLFPGVASADIIERNFAEKGSGKVASGFVFQGSRNMRHLKSGRKRSSSGLVVSPRISVPSLFAPRTKNSTENSNTGENRKPRFGYGAEERTDSGNDTSGKTASRNSTSKGEGAVQNSYRPEVVYQFRYRYPVHREYYFGSPFFYSRGCSPFGHHHSRSHSSVFRSISSSWFFGW